MSFLPMQNLELILILHIFFKFFFHVKFDMFSIFLGTDSGIKKLLKDIENLEQDVALLNEISDLVSKLNYHNQVKF